MKDRFFALWVSKLFDLSENRAEKKVEVSVFSLRMKSTFAKAIKTPRWSETRLDAQNDATEAVKKAATRRTAFRWFRPALNPVLHPFLPFWPRTACGRTLELSPTYDALRVFRVVLLIPRLCESFLPLILAYHDAATFCDNSTGLMRVVTVMRMCGNEDCLSGRRWYFYSVDWSMLHCRRY